MHFIGGGGRDSPRESRSHWIGQSGHSTSVGGEDTANHGDRRLENQKGGVRGVSSRLRPLEGHSSLVGLGLGRF